MKKLFSFVAGALMSASMFAAPASVPTVTDVASAGYDVTKRVIVLYFDEQVCNDIVWVGTYMVSGSDWVTDPELLSSFEPLEGFEGWYALELDDASDPCQGKPVQLKKDGSFAWDYQSGDAEAWINMAQPGTQTATIDAGYSGEANCTWPTTGVYIYEVAYFKLHNSPCVDKPVHDYTITAYLPEFCAEIAAYADSVRVMGGFDGWTDGIWMEKKVDEDFNDYWYAEIKDVEEGQEFKLRFGTDGDWAVQVQKDGENLQNEKTGETTAIVLQFDGEGYGFAACAEPIPAADYTITVTFPACEYAVPGIIGGFNNWEKAEVMTLVAGNTYTYSLTQATGSIKFRDARYNDWSSQIQMLGEDGESWVDMPDYKLNPEETTVVLDYSNEANYRWTKCDAETALENVTLAPAIRRVMVNGHMYINNNGKLINMLGF